MTFMGNITDLFPDTFPCEECIIRTMCNKSAVDGSLCEEAKKLIMDRVIKTIAERKKRNETKK
jgi:hypothetical protein